jgi:hypothetical protein
MKKTWKGALIALGTCMVLAVAATPAMADTGSVDSTVSGGTLTATTSGATLSGVTLDGSSTQTATGTASSQWGITDARGTGAPWTLSVAATDFTSAAGTVETTARTISAGRLTITPGTVTAGTGTDSATNITADPVTASTTAQAMVSAAGPDKGTYTLTPSFSLAVPANAYRSNYSGTVGSSALNPYTSTLTYTIG